MSTPLVSVIMPVFNRAELLPRAVRSVQSQQHTEWELLIIDDRSSDDTVDVAMELAKSDQRLRVLHSDNAKGPSGARNFGLDRASGKYIAYLDSDDEWHSHHLQTCVSLLEKHEAEVDIVTANAHGRRQSDGTEWQWTEVRKELLKYSDLCGGRVVDADCAINEEIFARLLTLQTMVGKREVLQSVRWDESLPAATDMMYSFELVIRRFRVCYLDDVHVTYWVHDGNMSNTLKHLSPEELCRIMPGYISYWDRVLSSPELTETQRVFATERLACIWAWEYGYCGFEKNRQFREARECYYKALRIAPGSLSVWLQVAKNLAKTLVGGA